MMLCNRPLNLLSTIKRCHYSRSSLLPTVLSASNLFITSSPAGRDSSQSDVRVASRTSTGELTDDERVVPFYLFQTGRHSRKPSPPVGFVRSEVVDAMRTMHKEAGNASPWKWTTAIQSHSGEEEVHGVSFSNAVDRKGHSGRTEALNALLVQWKKAKLFKDILRGWSNEQFPVVNPAVANAGAPDACFADRAAFAVERAALPLFGFPNYGSMLIAYFHDDAGQMKLWIPRRSLTKKTWPGALDVTVGGGIGMGDSPRSTIVRESVEEASLPADYVQSNARYVGRLSFPNRKPSGWLLPGYYYLFDMQLPSDGSVKPLLNPEDGEVDSFELMGVEEVHEALLQGKFKSSSALAMIKFLVRHGVVNEASDPDYAAVCQEMDRDYV